MYLHVHYIYITFMHLADAFIQSDLQLHSGYTFSLVCVFPGNRTHNLCAADAMLYHWATQEHKQKEQISNKTSACTMRAYHQIYKNNCHVVYMPKTKGSQNRIFSKYLAHIQSNLLASL